MAIEQKSNIYLRFLGTAATQPYLQRNASAVYLKYLQKNILIDCGEGVTRNILKSKESLDIDVIFITHLHGDHWYGILGLVDTLNKNMRTKPLYIYGPKSLIKIIKIFEVLDKKIGFKLEFIFVNPQYIIEINGLKVKPYTMQHSTVCYGYLFTYSIKDKIDPEKIKQYALTPGPWCKEIFTNEYVCIDTKKYKSADFIKTRGRDFKLFIAGDSMPCNSFLNVDYLIHECTYYNEPELGKLKKHTSYTELKLIREYYNPTKIFLTHISERFNSIIHTLNIPKDVCIVKDGLYIKLDD